MADTPADTSVITQELASPLTSTVDGQSATGRSIPDLVLGIQFQAAAAAVVTRKRGLRFTKLIGAAQLPIHRGNLSNPPGSFQ